MELLERESGLQQLAAALDEAAAGAGCLLVRRAAANKLRLRMARSTLSACRQSSLACCSS